MFKKESRLDDKCICLNVISITYRDKLQAYSTELLYVNDIDIVFLDCNIRFTI